MFLLQTDIFPWDLAILLLIAFGTAAGFLAWRRLRRRPRMHVIGRVCVSLIGILGVLGACLTIYGSFIEPKLLVVDRFAVALPLKKPLRIAVISDLHVGPYVSQADIRRIVEGVNATLPDVILIAGDFISTPASDLQALSPLSHLRSNLGTYAVLGNHDMAKYQTMFGRKYVESTDIDRLRAALKAYGVTVLANQRRTLKLPEGTLVIAGIDDLWSSESDLGRTLQGIAPDAAVILLAHNPDVILDPRSKRADLVVAGHTHGGQLRLPLIGSLTPIPDTLGRKYDEGVFHLDSHRTLAVTRGVGETLVRARLFAWPEVMVLEAVPPSP